ncbi:hypothetical protein V6N12_065447 [Hibiscus sabdariffa]|uniref:Uncharacterized protein n=1 Tax=Hibiscus sabdariffa TaxID=183260 RepID=A0ABR2G8Q6_9ROSI
MKIVRNKGPIVEVSVERMTKNKDAPTPRVSTTSNPAKGKEKGRSDEEEAEPQGNLGCSLIVKTPMVNVNTNNEEQNHASQRIDECLFDLNQEFATDLEERMYFTTLEVVTPDLPDVEEVVVEEINDENEDKEQSVEKDEVVIVA